MVLCPPPSTSAPCKVSSTESGEATRGLPPASWMPSVKKRPMVSPATKGRCAGDDDAAVGELGVDGGKPVERDLASPRDGGQVHHHDRALLLLDDEGHHRRRIDRPVNGDQDLVRRRSPGGPDRRGLSSATDAVWTGNPHSTATSDFGIPAAAPDPRRPRPGRRDARTPASSSVADGVRVARAPRWREGRTPGQLSSSWLGSATPQVSGVSCLRRNWVGEPTTSPPVVVRTPCVVPANGEPVGLAQVPARFRRDGEEPARVLSNADGDVGDRRAVAGHDHDVVAQRERLPDRAARWPAPWRA